MYDICSLVVSGDALGFGVGDVFVAVGMKKVTGAAVTVAMYNYTEGMRPIGLQGPFLYPRRQ